MFESVLQIKNVCMEFPYMDKKVLNKITYDVYKNDFVVILGSNGSGKSTLIKLIEQRLFPTSGSIEYYSLKGPRKSLDIMALTQNIQDSIFPNMTVLENFLIWSYRFKLFKFFVNKKSIAKQFRKHLIDINSPLQDKIHSNISCLSGGEMQALLLIVCFYMRPKLLLLDEHTSALDPKMSQLII